MELGMIGLGRMGAGMAEGLVRGHHVVGYDRDPEPIQRVVDKGAFEARSLADCLRQLALPRMAHDSGRRRRGPDYRA
jgi:6-phosphogluconate dehydrogenase (decarboxylating)